MAVLWFWQVLASARERLQDTDPSSGPREAPNFKAKCNTWTIALDVIGYAADHLKGKAAVTCGGERILMGGTDRKKG